MQISVKAVYRRGDLPSGVFVFLPLAQMDPAGAFFGRLQPWAHISPVLSCLTALRHGSNSNGRRSSHCRGSLRTHSSPGKVSLVRVLLLCYCSDRQVPRLSDHDFNNLVDQSVYVVSAFSLTSYANDNRGASVSISPTFCIVCDPFARDVAVG